MRKDFLFHKKHSVQLRKLFHINQTCNNTPGPGCVTSHLAGHLTWPGISLGQHIMFLNIVEYCHARYKTKFDIKNDFIICFLNIGIFYMLIYVKFHLKM